MSKSHRLHAMGSFDLRYQMGCGQCAPLWSMHLVGNEAGQRLRRTALVLPTLIAFFLCMTGYAAAANFSIPPPEMVAATPTAEVVGIASDGANGVWFDDAEDSGPKAGTDYMAHYVPGIPGLARVDVHQLPEGENGQIFGVAPGQNGAEWFTRPFRGTVARISSDGTVTDFALGGHASPESVVVDPSGNVWISIRGSDTSEHLDRLTPNGELSEWASGGGDPIGLTIGPDGNLWIAGFTGGVSEVSSTVKGQVTVYPLTFASGDEFVVDIASLDGKVWVTVGGNAPRIESISPSGTIHDYKLAGLHPLHITAGPDGAVWFTGYVAKSGRAFIGRLALSGGLSKFILEPDVAPEEIAATHDAVYFTGNGNQDDSETGLFRIPLSQVAGPHEYVALGDSYSSGEGDPPYETLTDNPGWNVCHRSEVAYPDLLDRELALGPLAFGACSGAVSDDLFTPNTANHEPAQFTYLLPDDTRTVTLTIGGDDMGFVEVLEHCIEGLRVGKSWPYWQGAQCSTSQPLRALLSARLNVLGGTRATSIDGGPVIHPLSEVFAAIHAEAPKARIVVAGYPGLFGAKMSHYERHPTTTNVFERACSVWPAIGVPIYWVLYSDAKWLNEEAQALDSVIQAAAVAAATTGLPVKYAPPATFKGHGLCDSKEAWVHPLELGLSPIGPEPSSFHLTAAGQFQGYEPAFAKALK